MWHSKKVAGTVLHKTWNTPTPAGGMDWRDVSFLVCDAEMSSLEVTDGELLSLGWVCIDHGAGLLESARHYLVKASNSVGQSAAIHQLRDCELAQGLPEAELLDNFLVAAAGRILVFHNAALDIAFLNQLSYRAFDAPLLMPCVDTLLVEQAILRRRDTVIKPADLRLQACRERYNLPNYTAHNALLDALATAELLIAQTKHRGGGGLFPLRNFL